MKLDSQFDRDIILYAFRYAITRQTYAGSLMRDKLDEIWPQLDDWDREQIIREVFEVQNTADRVWKEWAIGRKMKDECDMK